MMFDVIQILNENHEREQSFTKSQRTILLQEQGNIQRKIDTVYDDRLD